MAYLDITRTQRASGRNRSILARVWAYLELRRQRNALLHMTARELEDIGVTEAQAAAEASRPFWDAPAHWR